MFTGIIETLGTLQEISSLNNGKKAIISHHFNPPLTLGESIAINGVCTTVLDPTPTTFTIELLEETLNKTSFAALMIGQTLNLERAATPTTYLGGHILQGHVDETGHLVSRTTPDPFSILTIAYSSQNRVYLVPKGSIAIDGISLTVVDITDTTFSVHLIPHTQTQTTLSQKKPNDIVNLEYDILGKYLYNFYTYGKKL
jgi:riboflavin synthase